MLKLQTVRLLSAALVLLSRSNEAVLRSSTVSVSKQSAGGVQKVIELLSSMSEDSKKHMQEEQVAFAKFSTWCTTESGRLKVDIANNQNEIELLEAEIGKLLSDVGGLGEEIAKLNNNVADDEATKETETSERAKDHADFLAESKDFSESIDSLDRAIDVLQKQDYDRTGTKDALLQLSEREQIPERARSIISQFVVMMQTGEGSTGVDSFSYEAPEANAYEFQSGSIIDILEKLRDEFQSKLGTSQKEEMNSKHAYDMMMSDLSDSIDNLQKAMSEKTIEKQRKAQKAALDKKGLSAVVAIKAQNAKVLEATATECQEKTLSFQEKQKLRGEEGEAIAKALEILKSANVAGAAQKHLGLAQLNAAATALVQMNDRRGRRRVYEFLAMEGQRLHSQRLGLLAEKLAADPFSKVKTLIDSMLTRLLEESQADAQHEGFCDTEIGRSKITRDKLSKEIDGLSAAVEDGKSTILMLTESLKALNQEVETLTKSMGEATKMRNDEHMASAAAIKEAQAAQEAVASAKAVLKDFYAKALTATALTQLPSPRQWGLRSSIKMGTEEWDALANPNFQGDVDLGHKDGMKTFGEAYQGKQDEAEYGVLALLELIQSDFASLEADTRSAEAESEKAYEQFITQSKRSKATNDKKIEMNTADKSSAEEKLQQDITDLKANQDELLAADRYHAKLVPQCMDQGMSFEERTKAREGEIASLKKALEILSRQGSTGVL